MARLWNSKTSRKSDFILLHFKNLFSDSSSSSSSLHIFLRLFPSAAPTANMSTAVILGSTGAIGLELVRAMSAESSISTVKATTRYVVPVNADLPKLKRALFPSLASAPEEHVSKVEIVTIDWDKFCDPKTSADYESLFEKADIAVSALGTTRANAGSAAEFERIDKGYNLAAAQAAKSKNVKHYALVSSQGASSSSWLLYPRVKGEIEEGVKACGFDVAVAYRPGLLQRGAKSRGVEKVAHFFRVPSTSCASVAEKIVAQAVEKEKEKEKDLPKWSIVENSEMKGKGGK